jgi:hypothetical protein
MQFNIKLYSEFWINVKKPKNGKYMDESSAVHNLPSIIRRRAAISLGWPLPSAAAMASSGNACVVDCGWHRRLMGQAGQQFWQIQRQLQAHPLLLHVVELNLKMNCF